MQIKSRGITFSSHNISEIMRVLKERREEIPIRYTYTTLGWTTDHNGEQYFNGSEIVGRECVRNSDLSDSMLKSTGNFNRFIELIISLTRDEDAEPKPKAQAVIAASFSSALIELLGIKTLIFALIGKSGRGKSLLSEVATGVWGDPFNEKLWGSFNTTDGAVLESLSDNYGVVRVLDDGSLYEKPFHSLFYKIELGDSRDRLDSKYKKQEKSNWRTTVICSAESSMFKGISEKKLEGVLRRVISLDIEQGDLTDDEAQVRHLENTLKTNYGTAGIEFVRFLLDKRDLKCRYDEECDLIISEVGNDGIMQAYGKRVAVLTLTAKLLNDAFKVGFDADAIRTCLIKAGEKNISAYADNGTDNSFEEIYESLLERAKQYTNFEQNDSYNIPINEFKILAEELGYKYIALRKQLREKGRIICETGRTDRHLSADLRVVSFKKEVD